jgi:hypothetical protein
MIMMTYVDLFGIFLLWTQVMFCMSYELTPKIHM